MPGGGMRRYRSMGEREVHLEGEKKKGRIRNGCGESKGR